MACFSSAWVGVFGLALMSSSLSGKWTELVHNGGKAKRYHDGGGPQVSDSTTPGDPWRRVR